ncbi:MAG: hypothetical protein M0P12_01035 [Paludibacteraceae bacterium]|jgi:hypothetical protein|nr:hypothetical protein [Paludibacteraceae bacterium]MCK9615200.1 hypothetical protein [Candidatus Omnitrophota bacterium]
MDENIDRQEITVLNSELPATTKDKLSYKNKKIREFYNGQTLTEKLASKDMTLEDILDSLVSEYVREIDNLAGNIAMADEIGNIESSSVISTKRAEIVDKMLKAFMARKEFDAQSSIDVNSPSMKIIWRFFMMKCQESFAKSGFSIEISNIFFQNLTEVMGDWRKELKRQIAEIKT